MTRTSLFSEPMTAVDRRRPQFMGEGYNFPAFTTMSIMHSMVALLMSALGHSLPRWSRPTFVLLRFAPKATVSRQNAFRRYVPAADIDISS